MERRDFLVAPSYGNAQDGNIRHIAFSAHDEKAAHGRLAAAGWPSRQQVLGNDFRHLRPPLAREIKVPLLGLRCGCMPQQQQPLYWTGLERKTFGSLVSRATEGLLTIPFPERTKGNR